MGFEEFYERFPTEARCFRVLRKIKYSGKPVRCEYCNSRKLWWYTAERGYRNYTCQNCRYKFSDLSNTPFSRSRTSLRKWFWTISELSRRTAISAAELAERLQVTYKTAWRMLKVLREAMWEHMVNRILSGVVEVDETYIGGRRKGFRGRGAANKTAVLGMIERGGEAVAIPVDGVDSAELHYHIEYQVKKGSLLITDEWLGYNGLRALGFRHHRVPHHQTYVRGKKHTNTVEGFWSLLKRRIRAIHTWVSPKYLQNYLAEACIRYNLRGDDNKFDKLFEICVQPKG